MPTPAATAAGPIRRRSTFRALRRPEGRSTRGPLMVAYVPITEPNSLAEAQIGYVVSRRCGGAVERNRVRRRLRAAVREAARTGLAGGSYLIRTDPAVAALDHTTLVAEVTRALRDAPTGRRRQARAGPR